MLSVPELASGVARVVDADLKKHFKSFTRAARLIGPTYAPSTITDHLRQHQHLFSMQDFLAGAKIVFDFGQFSGSPGEYLDSCIGVTTGGKSSARAQRDDSLVLDVDQYQDRTVAQMQEMAASRRTRLQLVLVPIE